MKYYKLLNKDGTTPHGFGKWPLPKRDKPGAWMPPIDPPLIACHNGYHVLKIGDLLEWRGALLVEIETKGRPLRDSNKSVVKQARAIRIAKGWNNKTLRIFAADCAERVLPIWQKKYPNDDRPFKAIQAARAFAKGKISFGEMVTARAAAGDAAGDAGDAAGDAARDAARAAARDAAGDAAWDAGDAAGDAARAAARDAAGDAAWDAAWDAERKWQLKKLKEYLI